MTPPSDDMWLTLKQASKVFDVSISTLHRWREEGPLGDVGAHLGTDGAWKVPRQGLARLGYAELVSPWVQGRILQVMGRHPWKRFQHSCHRNPLRPPARSLVSRWSPRRSSGSLS